VIQKELYFIRHGQTDDNLKGIVQGKGVNLPLNDLGRRQARAFFDAYEDVPFDHIYTSSLLRAQETNYYPFRELGLSFEPLSELDEIGWGEMEGSAVVMESGDTFKASDRSDGRLAMMTLIRRVGRPSMILQNRQKKFIDRVLATSDQKILTSTQRPGHQVLTDVPAHRHAFKTDGGVSSCESDTLQSEPALQMASLREEKFNDTTHLAGI
jgi:probable phosphoglycerate mutase